MQSCFNDLLTSSIDNSDSDDENNEDICLISHEKLDDSHVRLLCSHKFNYGFIYAEVFNQKFSSNHNEIQRLKKYQFKCPYCRTIQDGVLPSNPNFPKMNTVNSPSCQVIKNSNCEYTFLSGKRKGLNCSKPCYGKYCNNHKNIIEKRNGKKYHSKLNEPLCLAATKKGTPCKRKATNKFLCTQHAKIQFKKKPKPDYINSTCIPVPTTNVVVTI